MPFGKLSELSNWVKTKAELWCTGAISGRATTMATLLTTRKAAAATLKICTPSDVVLLTKPAATRETAGSHTMHYQTVRGQLRMPESAWTAATHARLPMHGADARWSCQGGGCKCALA